MPSGAHLRDAASPLSRGLRALTSPLRFQLVRCQRTKLETFRWWWDCVLHASLVARWRRPVLKPVGYTHSLPPPATVPCSVFLHYICEYPSTIQQAWPGCAWRRCRLKQTTLCRQVAALHMWQVKAVRDSMRQIRQKLRLLNRRGVKPSCSRGSVQSVQPPTDSVSIGGERGWFRGLHSGKVGGIWGIRRWMSKYDEV